jgi:RND family efflux transporter MFP subunit
VTPDENLSRDLQSLRIDRTSKRRPPTAVEERGREDVPPPVSPALRTVAKIAGVLVVLGVLGVAGGKIAARAEASFFKTEVTFTEVGQLSPSQAQLEVTSTGYVVPQVVAKVGTKVMGRIAKVSVREGQKVKAGDVLFELDPSDQRSAVAASNARVLAAGAKVEAARAQLHEVEIQLARQKELVKVGAAPTASADDLAARAATLREQVRSTEADAVAARADVAQVSVGLSQTTVRAPIDGVAVTKPVELGDVVSPQQTLVELVDFTSLLVETDVPEARLGKIRPDGPCEIVLEAIDGQRFPGKVVAVGPRLNRSKATAQVKVRFDGLPTEIRPEMSARVGFLSRPLREDERKATVRTVVPLAAVTSSGGEKVVFVVERDKAKRTPVTLGETLGADAVLVAGPPPGTKLVRDPNGLTDGQPIKEKAK